MCGSEIVFIVNQTMNTSTTSFFNGGGICFFILRTYENNDQVTMNVTFLETLGSTAYLIYQKTTDSSYKTEAINLVPGANITYSFNRYDLADKNLYVVVEGLTDQNYSHYVASFQTIRSDIPTVIPNNSFIATLAVSALIFSGIIVFAVKIFEVLEDNAQMRRQVIYQNMQFQNRLGIDFESDRIKLNKLIEQTKKKFETSCFKYKNLLSN